MAKRDNKKALLKEAKERYQLVTDADTKQFERDTAALKFAARKQWPDEVMNARTGQPPGGSPTGTIAPARPTLVIDKTGPVIQQLVNELQSADIGVEIVPAGDFGALSQDSPADETEIDLRTGLLRRIQRSSEAADARLWAFQRAVTCGRGYYGLQTRYVEGKLRKQPHGYFDQEIVYRRFHDQGSVVLGPHDEPDGSDAEYGFATERMSWGKYKATYPKRNGKNNRVCGFTALEFRRQADTDEETDWFETVDGKPAFVLIVEYWYTEFDSRELWLLEDGTEVWADEVPEDATDANGAWLAPVQTREVLQRTVKFCKFDGCDDDVLEETDWVSPYIPIIKMLGREIQPYDDEHVTEGVVQPMMDPCRANNYMISKFVETVGLSPIPQLTIAAGQDEGFEDEYRNMNVRTIPVLHYNNRDNKGDAMGMPKAVQANSDVGNVATGMQIFTEAIKDVSAMPDPSLGSVDPSVKSGKLAMALIDQAKKANNHYLENARRSMSYDGKQVNAMLYPVYGRPGRVARIVTGTRQEQIVTINAPASPTAPGLPPQAPPSGTGAPEPPKNFILTEDFDGEVVIKISKAYDTLREKTAAFYGELISTSPEAMMPIFGDLVFKYSDIAGHQEAQERAELVLLPAIQAKIKGGPAALPPEAMAQMQQMQQAGQEMQAELQQLKLEKAGRVVQGQMDMQRTQMEIEAKHLDVAAQESTKLDIAGVQRDIKIILDVLKIRAEDARTDIERQQETRLAHHDKAHDAALTHSTQDAKHAHERDMANAAHANALDIIAATTEPEDTGAPSRA